VKLFRLSFSFHANWHTQEKQRADSPLEDRPKPVVASPSEYEPPMLCHPVECRADRTARICKTASPSGIRRNSADCTRLPVVSIFGHRRVLPDTQRPFGWRTRTFFGENKKERWWGADG